MIDVQTYKLVQGSRDGEEYCVDLSLLYVRIEFDTMYSTIQSYYLILKYLGLLIWLTIVTWKLPPFKLGGIAVVGKDFNCC